MLLVLVRAVWHWLRSKPQPARRAQALRGGATHSPKLCRCCTCSSGSHLCAARSICLPAPCRWRQPWRWRRAARRAFSLALTVLARRRVTSARRAPPIFTAGAGRFTEVAPLVPPDPPPGTRARGAGGREYMSCSVASGGLRQAAAEKLPDVEGLHFPDAGTGGRHGSQREAIAAA